MSSLPRPPLGVLFKEALPFECLLALLYIISQNLIHYRWFTPSTTLYIWTSVWLATTLLSVRFLFGIGPFMLAANGCLWSFFMLWDLSKEACVSSAEVTYGGIAVVVAMGVSFYFTVRFWKPAGASVQDDQVDAMTEKA
jgi:uncharacterized membrane protein